MENEEIKESNEMGVYSDEGEDEYDNYIQRLAETGSRFSEYTVLIADNKGRKVFTNVNMDVISHYESDADPFTIHKIGIVYDENTGDGDKSDIVWERKIVKVGNVEKKKWVPAYRDNDCKSENIKSVVELANQYRCGNCGIMSIVAYDFLEDKRGLSNLEIISIGNYHQFVVINRNSLSDLQDFNTWGDHCWICGPWEEIVCKAVNYIERLAEKMDEWQNAGRVIHDSNSKSWIEPSEWNNILMKEKKGISYFRWSSSYETDADTDTSTASNRYSDDDDTELQHSDYEDVLDFCSSNEDEAVNYK